MPVSRLRRPTQCHGHGQRACRRRTVTTVTVQGHHGHGAAACQGGPGIDDDAPSNAPFMSRLKSSDSRLAADGTSGTTKAKTTKTAASLASTGHKARKAPRLRTHASTRDGGRAAVGDGGRPYRTPLSHLLWKRSPCPRLPTHPSLTHRPSESPGRAGGPGAAAYIGGTRPRRTRSRRLVTQSVTRSLG